MLELDSTNQAIISGYIAEAAKQSAAGKIVLRWLVARHMTALIADLNILTEWTIWMLTPGHRQQQMEAIFICKSIMKYNPRLKSACALILSDAFLGE